MGKRKPKSLWLNPSRKPVQVDLRERFAWYPYFKKNVDPRIPRIVPVIWVPLDALEVKVDDYYEDEAERLEWIDTVARMMQDGEDIPPMFLDFYWRIADGNHRFEAAARLGITHVPVVEIDEYRAGSGS